MKVNEITLPFAKQYLRVDYDEDDTLIETMIVAAQGHIQSYLNRKFTDFDELPDEFTIVCLALIGAYYDNRSILPVDKAKEAIDTLYGAILNPYRYWQVGVSE